MKRIHLFLAAVVLGAGTLAGTAATAGAAYLNEVSVASYYIRGSLPDVHDSSDGAQYLNCYTYRSGSYLTGYCNASDAAGNHKGCTTTAGSNQLAAIQSITPDSSYLSIYLSSGYCTSISVTQGSGEMN